MKTMLWCFVISHSIIATAHSKKNFKFFVYDWPLNVTDTWPPEGNYTHHRLSFQALFRQNSATGPIISPSRGMHHTHQYSLYETIVSRFKESSYYTNDPTEAHMFFVPYDIGMDATTRSLDGALTRTNCPRLEQTITLLTSSPYFQRYQGKDHVVLHSINQPMLFFLNKYCRKWYEICWSCLKLSIDVYSEDVFSLNSPMTHNWQSIPFPSDYHYSYQVRTPPWKDRVYVQRPYAVAFSGSLGVTAKKSRRVRELIIELCRQRPKDCYLHTLHDHSSNSLTAHVLTSKKDNTKGYGPYYNASFCFMPGGDFPTRKAILDALLTGCVPVTFQNSSALSQWPWHWGSSTVANNVVINIPMKDFVVNPKMFFDAVINMSKDVEMMCKKREIIAQIGSRMQYRLPGERSSNDTVPEEPDAVDVILEHFARTHAHL